MAYLAEAPATDQPDDNLPITARTPTANDDKLIITLKKWFRADRESSKKWRDEAREDFDFVAGTQWSEKDQQHLKAQMRPLITFNRVLPIINSVSGHEISNRQEVRYLPREPGDAKPNEYLTEGARWFRDLSNADDEDTDAFLHAIICGVGCTETTLDYDEDEDGQPMMDSINPMEMFWDKNARKKNLIDADRVWRVRKMSLVRAKQLFPDASIFDLDAKWADDTKEGETTNQDEDRRYEGDDNDPDAILSEDRQVTIVHCEYKVQVTVYVVVDPNTGQTTEIDESSYRKLKRRLDELEMPIHSTSRKKTVVKQAFLGSKVLSYSDGLCGDHFRYQFITAFLDQNKGTFFGIVRSMKDPQRWANKWLAQSLDLLNSQVKGGVMMEDGAVENQRDFEDTWARADKPTIVARGALSGPNGPRIKEKPYGQFPANFFQLMEFAIASVRDVTGVSVEMLGMREADQPASLEFQRRQAGMTILAPLFQNLKAYRKDQGAVMLYLIQNYLADGRLVRIVGDEGAQYVPLMKQADVKYDIIIDDMPTSPNQKEMVWALIGDHFWNLPPPIQLSLIEFSPFPTTVVEKVKQAAQQASESPQAKLTEKLLEMEALLKQVEAGLKKAQTEKVGAETQKIASEIGMGGDPTAELQMEIQRMQAELAMQREKLMQDAMQKREKASQDIQLKQQKMIADTAIKRQSAKDNTAINAASARANAEIAAMSARLQAKARSANGGAK